MPAPKYSPLLRLRRLSLAAASALPLIISLGSAGTARGDLLLNRDISRLLYVGQIGSLSAFTPASVGTGTTTGYTRYIDTSELIAGSNTVYDETSSLVVSAISRDGSTVIGTQYNDDGSETLYSWSDEDGLTYLESATSGNFRFDLVNDDGTAFAGSVAGVAFYWHDGTFTSLGTLDGNVSIAYALSGDGTTVVGDIYYIDDTAQGFVWNRNTEEMTGIGFLEDGSSSYASLVSYDGSVVGGLATNASGQRRAVRWTAETGLVDLGSLEGAGQVQLNAMNRDGSVLVGWSGYQPAGQSAQIRAFRWANGTMRDIHAEGFTESRAEGVNDDGSVVVGYAQILGGSGSGGGSAGPGGTVTRGFRWTEETGMITVDQWLRDNGATLEEDITGDALFVSEDGQTIAGRLESSNDMYIAHVSEDSVGVIDVTDYVTSAAQTNSVAIGLQTSSASTIMFGAQGSPMRNLLEVGRRSAWGTVDTGYDSGTKSEGALVLGDFGFGYGLMDGVTVRL